MLADLIHSCICPSIHHTTAARCALRSLSDQCVCVCACLLSHLTLTNATEQSKQHIESSERSAVRFSRQKVSYTKTEKNDAFKCLPINKTHSWRPYYRKSNIYSFGEYNAKKWVLVCDGKDAINCTKSMLACAIFENICEKSPSLSSSSLPPQPAVAVEPARASSRAATAVQKKGSTLVSCVCVCMCVRLNNTHERHTKYHSRRSHSHHKLLTTVQREAIFFVFIFDISSPFTQHTHAIKKK